MKRKIQLSNLLLSFLLAGSVYGGNTFLDETSARVHEMWQDWMEMPPLTIDPIEKKDLKKILGEWHGSGFAQGEEELKILIQFHEDGRWHAESTMPEMPDARWYLHNNMVLLFREPVDSGGRSSEFFTAAVMKNGGFYLIIADDDTGLIELKKTEPDGGINSEAAPLRDTP